MSWIVKAICAILLLAACDVGNSDEPMEGDPFIKLYGGNGSEKGKDILKLDDGGFVLVGCTTSRFLADTLPNQDNDVYVVRTDAMGHVIWENSYDNEGHEDVGNAVILGPQDDLYICGYTGQDPQLRDVYVLNVSLDGAFIASNTFGIPDRDEIGTDILNIDTGFLITSTYFNVDASSFFMVTIPQDLNALPKIAEYIYGKQGVHNLSANSFAKKPFHPNDEDFICFGSRIENPSRKYNFQGFSYSPGKDEVVAVEFGTTNLHKKCSDACETTDGGFAMAGYQMEGSRRIEYVVKLNPQLKEVWNRSYDNVFGKSIGEKVNIIQTLDGGYMITSTLELTNKEISLLKINYKGDLEWRQTFGSTDDDEVSGVVQLDDGSYVLVGTIGFWINDNSLSKLSMIKVNPNGDLVTMN